ncbi:hypothetical protein [Amycolatopsis sp. cmx-4-68]|jgi:hypothetical protein
MTSRSRAVVAAVFAVFSFAFTLAGTTAVGVAAQPECVRPCHF